MTLQVLFNLVKLYKHVVVWMTFFYITLHKLYKSVVIPSVFDSWETWNDLKNKELLLLNRLQHFVEKHTEKFITMTRLDYCESMVRLRSTTCEIDQRNLFSSWKTVKNGQGHLVKNIFMHRLFSFSQYK